MCLISEMMFSKHLFVLLCAGFLAGLPIIGGIIAEFFAGLLLSWGTHR